MINLFNSFWIENHVNADFSLQVKIGVKLYLLRYLAYKSFQFHSKGPQFCQNLT